MIKLISLLEDSSDDLKSLFKLNYAEFVSKLGDFVDDDKFISAIKSLPDKVNFYDR